MSIPDATAHHITTLSALEARYATPAATSLRKEVDHVHPVYRRLIEASPFAVLATSGAGGLDASPRGDAPGFVTVHDSKTLWLPDRRGNNRLDSLRNVLEDPRVALLFLIPGMSETLRVNGRAHICVDPALLERLAVEGKPPCTVLVVQVEKVYFQCARALVRSALWQQASWPQRTSLPSPGDMLAALTDAEFGGPAYDQALPERLLSQLY
jgi:uncharacterized protein